MNYHNDWYHDGIENDEDCYRLDFEVDGNEYQAQLFFDIGPLKWCRLFIERDNRIPVEEGGDGERWDYACNCWSISADDAASLLQLPWDEVVRVLDSKIVEVAALPNDREFIKETTEFGLDKVMDYWRIHDASKEIYGFAC